METTASTPVAAQRPTTTFVLGPPLEGPLVEMPPPDVAGPPPDAAELEAVLRQLAKEDFALLRKNPPLLYHNDLTATTSRYYWSEDAGYALWLRLAHEHAHLRHSHPNG